MAKPNLKVIEDAPIQDFVRRPVEVRRSGSDQPSAVEATPLRKARHLNVDEVLARSLPKASGDISRIKGE